MRTFLRLLSLLITVIPSFIFANVYVHGTVRGSNGNLFSNTIVHIVADSNVNSSNCYQNHIKITDSLGRYTDTLLCSSNMQLVTVWVQSCGGLVRITDTLSPNRQYAEINIIMCGNNTPQCFSSFSSQSSFLITSFYSGSSFGSTVSDSIISRTWTFGDGTSLSGNIVNPVHTFTQAGSYNVCLKIKTVSGCESMICKTIQATPNTGCYAYFFSIQTYSNIATFNSSASYAVAGDSIISRKWKFGDGDSLTGNTINPIHNYTQYNVFNACLTIKTRLGCEKTYCYPVYITNPQTSCRANFLYSIIAIDSNSFTVKFSSRTSSYLTGDSIISCRWIYGDGTSGGDSTHQYSQPGTYTACLQMTCASGCRDTICKTVIIGTQHCRAGFWNETVPTPSGSNSSLFYKHFVNQSTAAISDSVITCKWNFGDGTSQITTGSVTHGYTLAGTYNVCLYIITATGCRDTLCGTIIVRDSTATTSTCQPRFATNANGLLVTFNANTSTTATGDSIISRSWNFGDGVTINNNALVLTHQYPRAGIYQACLTIRTRLGCTSTTCKTIAVITVPGNCVPFFTKEQIAATPKTIRFNSSAAYSQIPNDSIIARKWEFGDGQILLGNVVNPLHTYLRGGTYTACLTIYTAHCDKRWCQTIQVLPLDSTNTSDSVNIVSLYPVPVTSPLNVVLHSSHANVNAQLAIYDVYGVLKTTQSVVLPLGNTNYSIPTAQLAAGPYIFKLTTVYGIKSRSFYKL